jgi:acyl carrier protein
MGIQFVSEPNSRVLQDADVYRYLDEVFRDLFRRGDIVIHPNLSAPDVVGWDSFRQVEIVLSLEERYSIRIRTRELEDVATLGDLVAVVLRKTGAMT